MTTRISTHVDDARFERVRFATPRIAIGELRGGVHSCYFRGEQATSNFIVAFPRTALWIRQDRGTSFVADASIATIYNRGQGYARRPISPFGDCVDWYAVAEDIVRAAVATFDARAADSDAPLPFTRTRVSPALYRRQRELFHEAQDPATEPVALEERAIGVFAEVVNTAFGERTATSAERRAHLELVECARAVIAETWEENLGVAEIAGRCNTSVFHLCRTFRRTTGQTMHGFRRDLRLRAALARVRECRGDLSRLALDLGFSSHSHFTAAFRRQFGVSPTHGSGSRLESDSRRGDDAWDARRPSLAVGA